MLLSLSIHHFAIIEDLDVSFSTGMSILTGETGAGKSILIDALSLLTGERSDFDKIRTGANKAMIEGTFLIQNEAFRQQLKEQYGEDILEGETLLVSRVLDVSGRSVLRVNGIPFPLSKIREIMPHLIDIHSQNENVTLLDEKQHLSFLDAYIGESNEARQYQNAYQHYLEEMRTLKELEKTCLQEEETKRIQEEIQELQDANIHIGELSSLEEEKRQCLSLQKIVEGGASFLRLIEDEPGVLTHLYLAKRELEKTNEPLFATHSEKLEQIYYDLQDIVENVHNDLERLEIQSQNLQEIDDRIYFLRRLEKKYGGDEEDLCRILQEWEEKLYQSNHHDQLYQEQKAKVERAAEICQKAADQWRTLREKKAKELEQLVDRELQDLYLQHAHFSIRFIAHPWNEKGSETVQFLLSANQGTPFLPLKNAISGGETSRVMLALKTIFQRYSGVETVIFDEVDAGISGRVAMQVARKMKEIAQHTQVLVISHLPQVAAMADTHYHVEKIVEKGETKSTIQILSEKERMEEIAKLLSGDEISEASLEAAKFLKKEADTKA